MYTPIVIVPLTDLLIWFLGVYGIAWAIVFSYPLSFLRDYIFTKEITSDCFAWKVISKLITCIVCTSFWVAASLVNFYFVPEIFITKILIIFSTVSFTWFAANKFGDYEDL